MPTPGPEVDGPIARVAVSGELDRQAIEAIRLEVRRLGRQLGFEVRESRGPSAGS